MSSTPVVTTDDITPSRKGSRVAAIRRKHEGKEKTLDLPVPRFGDEVMVRYKRIKTKTLTGQGKSARRGNAKILVDSCVELFVRGEDGELIPMAEDEGIDSPVRFDGNLADLFELRGDNPVAIALAMFQDDVTVAFQAKRLFDWQTGADVDEIPDEEIDDLLGEEDAAT